MIRVEKLRKVFGDAPAVEDVSFEIPAGQICGYLGPNGAGKSTTVKMLTGMVAPTGGRAEICGHDVGTEPLTAKAIIGLVPETGAVYESLTPVEYLEFVGGLYKVPAEPLAGRIIELRAVWGLSNHADQRMTSFSKGMRQKVAIAASLIHDPRVVLLDEPLNGLDANAALLLKEILRALADRGRTILYCSHILDVVERFCDRVIIIHHGRMIADDTPAALKAMASHGTLEAVFTQLTNTGDTRGNAHRLLAAIGAET